MAQHDYVIDNQTAPNFRTDLNSALSAIVSNNSGTSAPSTTYANMMWYDTTNNLLRMRNESDDAWITLGTLDQVEDKFYASINVADGAEALAGTNDTKVMTPLKVRNALSATGSAPIYACRAWVFFNGSTGTISASGNVSSITKNATGDYFVNFATALPDTSYATLITCSSESDGFLVLGAANSKAGASTSPTVDKVRIFTRPSGSTTNRDPNQVYVAIFR